MIVSNPPYIASDEIASLMEEVRDHEPRMALDGGRDGLAFYRRILQGAGDFLKKDGWLLVEIGFDQGEAVRSMFEDHRYKSIRVIKDLAGLDRVVLGQRGD
jgi:release factor glutamine methyltransferase